MTIAAIGTANKIPKNHIIIPQRIIEIKITTLLIPRDLFIIRGIRILFSMVLIRKITQVITKNHKTPKLIPQIIAAGIHHTTGHTYGTISSNPRIRDNDNLFGISIPNNSIIHRDIYIETHIYTDNNNLCFNHIHNCL